MTGVTPKMATSWGTLRTFFAGDPDVDESELDDMLTPVGSFLALTAPHHGSEAVTGVALRCGFAIATNGDVVHPASGALIRAGGLIDALASFAAHSESSDLHNLPTTTEPEVT